MNYHKLNRTPISLMFFALLVLVSGCSSVTHSQYAHKMGLFPNQDLIAMQAKDLPALKVPVGIPVVPNEPFYVIPDESKSTGNGIVSLEPPSLSGLAKPRGNND